MATEYTMKLREEDDGKMTFQGNFTEGESEKASDLFMYYADCMVRAFELSKDALSQVHKNQEGESDE